MIPFSRCWPQSTTVARLLDDMSAPKFWQELQEGNANKKHTVMKGVRIGHEVNSCTVVPTPFTLEPRLHITDMPGFAESNAEKKISIDILQKCFMTYIDRFTLVIVVEAGLIFQNKFQMLRDDYHKALWNLLGSQYQHGIPHFYFLLTKKHQMENQSMSMESVLNKGIRQLMTRSSDKDTALFAQFLARLCDYHVIVDLETCTNASLLKDIKGMIKDGEDEAEGLHIPSFNVSHLAAGENKLNEMCLAYITDTALPKQSQLSTQSMVLEDDWAVQSTELREETKTLRKQKREAIQNETECEGKLQEVTKAINSHPTRKRTLEDDLEAARRRHAMCTSKLAIFKEEAKDDDFINIRVDVSIKTKKMGRPIYVSDINADIASEGATWDHLIVMDFESHNDSLRTGLGGSLVPDKLQDVENIDGPNVLFNSKTGVARGDLDVERPLLKDNQGWRCIKLKCPTPFKVFIFTARRFSKMPFFKKLQDGFKREVEKEEEEVNRIGQLLVDLDEQHLLDKDTLTECGQELAEARQNLKNIEEEVDAVIQSHPMVLQKFRADLSQLEDEINAWQKNDLVANVGSIIDILQENNIQTKAAGIYEEFSKRFRAIFQRLHGLKSNITIFEAANSSALQEINDGQVSLESA